MSTTRLPRNIYPRESVLNCNNLVFRRGPYSVRSGNIVLQNLSKLKTYTNIMD